MPPSLPPDRHRPAAIAQSVSPDPSLATKRLPRSESFALRAKIDRPPDGRNSRSCCPKIAPECVRLPVAAPPLPATPPDTRSRIPRCSHGPSARFPADSAKARSRKYQSDSNSPSAAWTAPAATTLFFARSRSPAPPPTLASAAETRSRANLAAAIAFPRGSAHTPATNKSHQTAPTPPHHTNISKAALSVPCGSARSPRRSRIPPSAPLQPVKPPPLPYVVRMPLAIPPYNGSCCRYKDNEVGTSSDTTAAACTRPYAPNRPSSRNVFRRKNPPNIRDKIQTAQIPVAVRMSWTSTPIHFPADRKLRTRWPLPGEYPRPSDPSGPD